MTRAVLILSPFATWPETAGHRRRTAQVTRLLRDAGWRVTFLLYAFEDAWTHRFDEAAFDTMRRDWPEVLVFHANGGVGGVPEEGRHHRLDAWWDPALGAFLDTLFSRRRFDAFVVHNLWLSRAFMHAPPGTARVLEMHDLFHRRDAVFSALGLRADFFLPTEGAELEGLARADTISAIQAGERDWIHRRLPGRALLLPYADAALLRRPRRAPGYLEPGVVRFGVLASAHSLNLHGIDALLRALRAAPAAERARARILVGGAAARFLDPTLPCERIPDVPDEAAFYARCDIALVPNAGGTGFKIKLADALALGLPVLATAHGAEGLRLPRAARCAGPEEMAARILAIARERPSHEVLCAGAARAAAALHRQARRGAARFLGALAARRPEIALDLRPFRPGAGILPLLLLCNPHALGALLQEGRPVLQVSPCVAELLRDLLPHGVALRVARADWRAVPAARAAGWGFRRLAAWAAGSGALAAAARAEALSAPGFRHEPMAARLLWAHRAARRPMRLDDRPVLVARPSRAGDVFGVPRATAPAPAAWRELRVEDHRALEDLAVALVEHAGRRRVVLGWVAPAAPARVILEAVAAACGHGPPDAGEPARRPIVDVAIR
jgi:glycosyltransferase involved in cell wall biosynthesis